MRIKTIVPVFIIIALIATLAYSAVLGIDLSSENIKVSAVRSGTPFHIVVDEQAKRKVPVAVAFDDGERHFGNNALGFAIRKPLDTYLFVHRLIGQGITNDRTLDLQKSFDYNMIQLAGRGDAVGIEAPNGEIFSPEELIAMSFEHILKIADDDGNTGARDAVVTVPWWFTSMEKQALLDAASLANVNVVSLITDTGASAVSYGIDRVYNDTSTTQRVVLVDIGSSGAELSLVELTGVKQRGGKIAGHAFVTHSIASDTVGGHYIDRAIRNYFLTILENQLADSSTNPDGITIDTIRNTPRSMAKLLKQATSAKTVLSANSDLQIKLEAIYKEIHLYTKFSRDQLNEIMTSMLTDLERLCEDFLATLPENTTIDDVVIVGGTVRIPAVQQALRNGLKTDKLSQTINGDEAMTMGAVFVSANYSTSFQTKPFLFTDNNNADVHIHLHDEEFVINTDYAAEKALHQGENSQEQQQGNTDDENRSKQSSTPGKHVLLFPRNSPINKRKTITLTRSSDMLVSLNHDIAHVCKGCHAAIKGYAVEGIDDIFAKYIEDDRAALQKEIELGLTRNSTSGITFDQNGEEILPRGVRVAMTFNAIETSIPRLVHADAVLDDWVIVDETKEKAKKQRKAEKAPAAAAASTNSTDATGGEDKPAVEEPVEPEVPQQSWRLEKRVRRVPLTVRVLDFEYDPALEKSQIRMTSTSMVVNGFLPLSSEQYKKSQEKLQTLSDFDRARRHLAETRNTLESLIYTIKSDVLYEEDRIISVTNQEQRDELYNKAVEAGEWLDEHGYSQEGYDGSIDWYYSRANIFNTTITALNEMLEPVQYRYKQFQEREQTVELLTTGFELITNTTRQYKEQREWVRQECEELETDLHQFNAEWKQLLEQQQQLPVHEPPVFINADVIQKMSAITQRLRQISRIKAPAPPKTEEPPAEATSDQQATGDQQEQPQDNQDEGKEQHEQEQQEQGSDNASGSDASESSSQDQQQQAERNSVKDEL